MVPSVSPEPPQVEGPVLTSASPMEGRTCDTLRWRDLCLTCTLFSLTCTPQVGGSSHPHRRRDLGSPQVGGPLTYTPRWRGLCLTCLPQTPLSLTAPGSRSPSGSWKSHLSPTAAASAEQAKWQLPTRFLFPPRQLPAPSARPRSHPRSTRSSHLSRPVSRWRMRIPSPAAILAQGTSSHPQPDKPALKMAAAASPA